VISRVLQSTLNITTLADWVASLHDSTVILDNEGVITKEEILKIYLDK
jgi:hypothetical protein